jgi:hypothetical protein
MDEWARLATNAAGKIGWNIAVNSDGLENPV